MSTFTEYASSGVYVCNPEPPADGGRTLNDNFRALVDQDGATAADLATHAADTAAHGATSGNTAGRIVVRNGSGGFSAGTVSAANVLASGQVGVGTASPSEPLEVVGTAKATRFVGDGVVPVAGMVPFAGAASPDGYLLCDGSAVSRTTFADLFAVIGITYGDGDGSTSFNLPDLSGNVLVGVGYVIKT